ncbi:8431_t:CDS:2, partial [Funneliformis caledonium]
GVVHVEKALDSARSARKKKWYCFFIAIVLLAIFAAVLYIYVIKPMLNKQK